MPCTLGFPPKASVGKWDTGFAVGVEKGSGGGGGAERGGGGGAGVRFFRIAGVF